MEINEQSLKRMSIDQIEMLFATLQDNDQDKTVILDFLFAKSRNARSMAREYGDNQEEVFLRSFLETLGRLLLHCPEGTAENELANRSKRYTEQDLFEILHKKDRVPEKETA